MRTPHVLWRVSLAGLACWLAAGAWAQAPAFDRLLTDAEVKALERENALWRMVRTDDDVAANLAQLKKAGAKEAELAAMEPRLVEWWDVPYERNFGWLHEDTAARIRDIDRVFISRVRAMRLYAGTGVRSGGEIPPSAEALERQWRRAILKALDYDEVAEFRLMNSASAREVSRRVQGLALTADEQRTLFEWQREFEQRRRGYTALVSTVPAALREEQLDEWQRTRDLLGDERFAIYLGRAHAAFIHMQAALGKTGPVESKVALDLWWLRQKEGAARDAIPQVAKRDEATARMRLRAQELLGEARLTEYSQDPDARWIVIPERPATRRPALWPPRPATAPAKGETAAQAAVDDPR